MPAGTITLTNNSTAVTGSGTAFTTELKANDFVVAVVGGTTYTLGVKSVESATALTLATAYGGPTTGGLAWTPIPNGTLVGITAQIAADTARAIRGLNYDKQNWQQLLSIDDDVTILLPDGSSYRGQSWLKISRIVATAFSSANLTFEVVKGDAIAPPQGTIVSGGKLISNYKIAGGVAASASLNASWSYGNPDSAGNLMVSNNTGYSTTFEFHSNGDLRLGLPPKTETRYSASLALPKSQNGGVQMRASDATFVDPVSATRQILNFEPYGTLQAVTLYARGGMLCQNGVAGTLGALNSYSIGWDGSSTASLWIDTTKMTPNFTIASDALLKKDIVYQSNGQVLDQVCQWKPATFKYKSRGVLAESSTKLGFIANDLVRISPECVIGDGLQEDYDPLNPDGCYELDPVAMIAKLVLAVQELAEQNKELQKYIDNLNSE